MSTGVSARFCNTTMDEQDGPYANDGRTPSSPLPAGTAGLGGCAQASVTSNSGSNSHQDLLHCKGLFGLVSLLPDRVGDGHRDHILPGSGLRQQVNPHRSRHVALGVETLALFHLRLVLPPQYLPAGRDHARDVAHIDAILFPILKPDDVELSPYRIAAFVDGFLHRLRVVLSPEELKIPHDQRIAGLYRLTADSKRHTKFGLRVGHQVFNLD